MNECLSIILRETVDQPYASFPKCHFLSSLAQANLFEILTVSIKSPIDSWPGAHK